MQLCAKQASPSNCLYQRAVPPVVVPIRNTYVPSLGLLFKKYSVEHNLLVLRIASYLSRILYHIIMIV